MKGLVATDGTLIGRKFLTFRDFCANYADCCRSNTRKCCAMNKGRGVEEKTHRKNCRSVNKN